ncbi:MAG: hypothetical protein M1826_006384 [Phylliscum demangeonii]|nr:MAG: hypothetical protein M1826_006384 [Phylliscum demangeonii]
MSTARPVPETSSDDNIPTGLELTLAVLVGVLAGTLWQGQIDPVYNSDHSTRTQIAALSTEDRETLRQLRPRRGEVVTSLDKKFFSICLKANGATQKTAIKYILPIAVKCKQKLADIKARRRDWKQRQEAARQSKKAIIATRRAVLDARRAQRRHRNRNQFGRATVALDRVGRMLDVGLRRVFDPNFHPATTAAAAHGSLAWKSSTPNLVESALQEEGRLLHAAP